MLLRSKTTSPLPATPTEAPPPPPAEIWATELVDTALTATLFCERSTELVTSAFVLRSTISVPTAPATPDEPIARAVAELATMAWLAAIT